MRTQVVMPQMGESVAEGTLTTWLKEIGDRVERDEPLFEITTDKVDAEVPSPVAGVLLERLVEPGTTVEINTIVAIIDAEGDAAGDQAGDSEPHSGERVGQGGAERPDQSAPRQPAPSQAAPARSAGAISEVRPSQEQSAAELQRARSTPLVRKIAAEHGVSDLHQIPATGRNGRVTKRDILAFLDAGGAASATPRAPSSAPPASAPPAGAPHPSAPHPGAQTRSIPGLPPVVAGQRDRVEPMTPQRLAIARHMIASRATSAHAHTVHEVDFGRVVAARTALKAEFAGRGVKLTYTAFMVKAFADALAAFPIMNASVDAEDNIVYRGAINVGVAVALDDSLIVPVVRDVDEMSLLGVARAVNDLASRARSKKLSPDDVKGGTFTLSNHGVFGPEFGVPVVNQPQVAIVATGAIKKRVVVDQKSGAILVRPTAMFCMSFDHRLVDGASADKFLMHARTTLEGWQA